MKKHRARQRHTKSTRNKASVLDCLVPPNIESRIILAGVTTAHPFCTAMAAVSTTSSHLHKQHKIIHQNFKEIMRLSQRSRVDHLYSLPKSQLWTNINSQCGIGCKRERPAHLTLVLKLNHTSPFKLNHSHKPCTLLIPKGLYCHATGLDSARDIKGSSALVQGCLVRVVATRLLPTQNGSRYKEIDRGAGTSI